MSHSLRLWTGDGGREEATRTRGENSVPADEGTSVPADEGTSLVDPGTSPNHRLARREALAGAGGVSLALTAGCLDTLLSVGGSQEEVEPKVPGDDPDGTPGEFYHHLESSDVSVEEMYLDSADDDDLLLFYETGAETPEESNEEIESIYAIFRDELVDHETNVRHLYTEVVDGFDGQTEGWGVNAQWAEQELAGEASVDDVLGAIESTRVYPDDSAPAETDDADDPIEIGSGTDEGTEADEKDDGAETDDAAEADDADGIDDADTSE